MSMLNRLLAGIFVVVALALVGCGDDGGGDGSSGMGDPPVADFSFTPNCTTTSDTEITFTSSSSDTEDGTTLDCSWTFGSCTAPAGCTSTQCTQTGVKFPNVTPYPVTLTVTDSDGNSDTVSMMVGPC